MNDPHRATRFAQDFVTNPCWADLLTALREMERKEQVTLQALARGGEIAKINHQGGVIDGLQRTIMRLENMEKDARETMKNAPVAA